MRRGFFQWGPEQGGRYETHDFEKQVQSEPVVRKFRIRKEVSDALDLYVKIAQENIRGAEESLVIEAILKNHLKRDKGFRARMKQNRDAQNQAGP
jgi:hypothetical protein